MTPELYQRAKEIFQGATELPPADQRAYVDQKAGDHIELRNEVLSLLAHHDEVAAESEGLSVSHKLRNRTPLREVRKFKRRTEPTPPSNQPIITSLKPQKPVRKTSKNVIYGGISGLIALIMLLQFWMYATLQTQRTALLAEDLSKFTSAAQAAIQEHCEHITQTGLQLIERDVNDHTMRLLAAQGSADELQSLRSQLADSIKSNGLTNDEVILCNGIGTILFHQQQPQLVTSIIGAEHLPLIVEAIRDQSPGLVLSIGQNQKESAATPRIWILAPMKDADGQLKGILLLSRQDWYTELDALLVKLSANAKLDCYLVSNQGYFLTRPALSETLRKVGWIENSDALQKRLRVVDPEVNLRETAPNRALESLPLTQAAYALSTLTPGSNVSGYRNYVGQTVVGNWRWLEPFQFGLIIERDYEQAFAWMQPMKWMTQWILLLATLALLALLVARRKLPWVRSKPSESVGPYQLLEPIARGGMGVVYRAQHELLKRPSAVKVIRSDRLTADEVARFEREVRVASRLHCPHTISIFDFGQSDDGKWYFAMEYLNGMTIEQLVVRHGTLSVDRTIHVLIQIGESLHEAHEQGLVHRDIKPQNVMLTCRGSSPDFAVVFDFGLAKPIHPKGVCS